MIDRIKSQIYSNIEILFGEAAVNEMTGDTKAFKEVLKKIAAIAEVLGISTEIIQVSINVKDGSVIWDVEVSGKDNGTDLVNI